ncbi:MAG: hypothetical protein ACKOS8_01380, partial [Gemmataceae bacterium]
GEVGLVALACHASRTGTPEEVRRAAEIRAPRLSVSMIPRLARNPGLGSLPHALVFDGEGKLRFSGSPYDGESAVRKLLGRQMTDKAEPDLEDKAVARLVGSSVEALRRGEKPAVVLARLERLTPQEETARSARDALIREITTRPKARVDELQNARDLEPARVFTELEAMAQRWKNTSLASLLTLTMGPIRKNPEVQRELRARVSLERVKALEAQLARRPGGLDPTSAGFRAANADLMKALELALQKMRPEFTGTPALAEAERLVGKYQP